MLIDTHSHLFTEEFDEDFQDVVLRAKSAGVDAVYMPNIDVESLPRLLKACEQYPDYLFPMIGLHPTSVGDTFEEDLRQLRNELHEGHPYVGIGEVGMDLYWDKTYLLQQQKVLDEQVQWALEWQLPLIVHCRDAFAEMYDVLAPYIKEPLTGIFHCFTGSPDEAVRYAEFPGFCFGVNGCVTYKKSTLPEMLRRSLPLERLVVETDSPYLAPVPYRGRRNETAYVLEVAKKLSDIFEVPMEQVCEVTSQNARKIFRKAKQ